jgi:hypothetical protein
MALTATYHDPVTEIGSDGFQSFTKLPAATANLLLENDMWLKNRPFGIYANWAATQTTTSTSFVAVTSVSVTITTTGSRVMLLCNGGVWDSGAFSTRLDLAVDGTRQGDTTDGMFVSSVIGDSQAANTGFSLAFVTAALAAGSHTFALYWSTSGGTLSLDRVFLAAFEV